MKISIIGCGWFGLPFAKTLIREGHHVKGSTTSVNKLQLLGKENIEPFLIDVLKADHELIETSFFNCDVLVITIPPKVRSNPESKYLSIIQTLIQLIIKHQIRKVLYISSTGVYGDYDNHVDETTIPVPDSLSGRVLLEAESSLRSNNSFQTTIIRFGGLFGPGRDPANFFSGKKDIPNGLAPVNLIHLDDCCGIGLEILKKSAFGYLINACSPEHPRKMDFYRKVCVKTGMPLPEFQEELLHWKIVDSIYIQPLLGYNFSHSLI